jgi:hypothetical protein
MSPAKRFFQKLGADLRERQLLPAVVVLAVLVVAIPIAATIAWSGVSTPPQAPLPPTHVTLPKGIKPPAQELVVLSTPPAVQSLTRHGTEPNPFREQVTPPGGTNGNSNSSTQSNTKASTSKPTTPAKTTVKAPTKKTTPPKTTPKTTPKATKPSSPKQTTKPSSGSTGSSGPPLAQATPTTGPAKLSPKQAYVVNIDTKDATGTHTLTNVVRLDPLPAAETPEVIYLGVLTGGKKAAFLFTNAVKVTTSKGDNLTCLPSDADCQIAELAPGQGMSLAPTSNTALIATFTFELMSISAQTFASADAATQARDAVSTAGQALLPLSTSTALQTLQFDSKTGALVHSAPSSGSTQGSTGSSGSTGTTGPTGTSGSVERFPGGISFVVAPTR